MSARIARALLLSGVIGFGMAKPVDIGATTELPAQTTPGSDSARINALPFEDDGPPPAAIPTPGSGTLGSDSASEELNPQVLDVDQAIPSAHVLDPLTYYNGIGDEADPGLYDSEDFYWGDGSKSRPLTRTLTNQMLISCQRDGQSFRASLMRT
jgi:hypothetical protein